MSFNTSVEESSFFLDHLVDLERVSGEKTGLVDRGGIGLAVVYGTEARSFLGAVGKAPRQCAIGIHA